MDSKTNINDNINFLINKKVDNSLAKDQIKVLDSTAYNETFKSIEASLNLLYEKTRAMQDIINYTNSFIRTEIDNSITECKSILNNIEGNRDVIKNSAYINYNVKLQSNFDTYSDRNNSAITGVHMHNNTISLSTNSIETVELNNIIVESKSSNHNVLNTKEDVLINNTYRTFYMFNRPQKDAIKEKIIINLQKVKTINKINLMSSNCSISEIEFIDENGNSEIVKGYDTNLFKNRNVKSLIIYIESSNYMVSQINYNEVKNEDFWNVVNNIKNDENLEIGKEKYYYYLFGLDNVSIEYVTKNMSSTFISNDIKIDSLKENEYITLESEYSCEKGSIEFSIIDGTSEIPILPENENEIIKEKVFYKIPTRFTIDDINSIKIYEDDALIKMSLSEAMNSTDEKYTVSYLSKNTSSINNLLNDTIKVKATIRSYDENYIPFIKSIKIKKFGGSALWIDNIKL